MSEKYERVSPTSEFVFLAAHAVWKIIFLYLIDSTSCCYRNYQQKSKINTAEHEEETAYL